MSHPSFVFERQFWKRGLLYVAGLDEVGRGAWAGPVVAGACVFSPGTLVASLARVNDSKQLTPRAREELYDVIRSHAFAWGVGMATNSEIDSIGIVPATRLAMMRALDALQLKPDALLIDALKLPERNEPQRALIRGDARAYSIAAASILAKVARDRLMRALDAQFPGYHFAQNKGYGTRAHQDALRELGAREIHRQTFAPIKNLKLVVSQAEPSEI